jgi:APA family basic amino acid/polyamine antiporter
MLSFTMAHAAVTWLRFKEPGVERPWKGPGSIRVAGGELPVFAVLGGLGTGSAFVVVTVLDVRVLISGVVWLTIGVVAYVVYRRTQGLPLTETRKVVVPKPAVEHEVEYESVLVAFEDGAYSPGAVDTAARLAVRRRRGIHVLVTITVPANAPIDASMPEQESRAAAAIDSARVRGGRRVTGHWEKVRPGEAGRRVLEEAREIQARAIVMSVPPKRVGSSLFGRTVETVLSDRPCRVIIDSTPAQAEEREAVVADA